MKATIEDLYLFNKETGLIDSGKIKVKTKTGFKNISAVDITKKNSKKIKVFTEKNSLIVSPEHLLFKTNVDWIQTQNLKIGDFIDTKFGSLELINIEKDEKKEDLYDIQVDGEEYYANGIRSHNSSIQQAIDLAIFRQVRGKNKSKISFDKLPNRTNKRSMVNIKFLNNNDDQIETTVNLSPNNFQIKINQEDITNKFKKLDEKEREKIIGFNYKTFKAFISMSVNDFLNFISLSTDDKKNLLNKLFDLEELDDYLSIVKDLLKINKETINLYKNKIDNNKDKMSSLRETIQLIQESEQDNIKNKRKQIKELINSKKEPFQNFINLIKNFEKDISDSEFKKQQLQNLIELKKSELLKKRFDLNHCNEKIKIFESGKCPMCDTSLKDKEHKHNLKDLHQEKIDVSKEIDKIKIIQNGAESEFSETSQLIYGMNIERNKKDKELIEIKFQIGQLKNELKEFKEEDKEDVSVENLKMDGQKIVNENKVFIDNINQLQDKTDSYRSLIALFGTDGIRKDIITNIVNPINQYLEEFLNKINFPYRVELNDEFNAMCFERDINEIHSETLSTGEEKMVNICIALSYLKLIRKVKNINLLFLDEVFNSIDNENIDLLLKLLKEICVDMNINIIVVHHGVDQVNSKYFDRAISLTKNYFTEIEEISI